MQLIESNLTQVRSVLSMDFDLNMLGDQGQTPLIRAAQRGDAAIVRSLAATWSRPGNDRVGGTAADIALRAGYPELATKLRVSVKQQSAEPPPGELDTAAIG